VKESEKGHLANFERGQIVGPLCSVLETRARNRFPPPTSLKQLEDVLQEEWYKIPLQTVQNLYEAIPRRTAAVLKAKGGANTILIKKCVQCLYCFHYFVQHLYIRRSRHGDRATSSGIQADTFSRSDATGCHIIRLPNVRQMH
jgi:hypothetical protein